MLPKCPVKNLVYPIFLSRPFPSELGSIWGLHVVVCGYVPLLFKKNCFHATDSWSKPSPLHCSTAASRTCLCASSWFHLTWFFYPYISRKLEIEPFPFYRVVFLRCNSHNIKFALLKWAVRSLSVSSQSCTTIATIQLQKILIAPKRSCVSISGHPDPASAPAPRNHQSTFFFYGFIYSGYSIEMES